MTDNLLAAIGISTIAAAALALVARRVGQPLILGYIVGGVLLGSHLGFGLVHDEAAIDLIAEIGLILLLFMTGLLQVPLCAALAWVLFGGLTATTGGPFDRLYLVVAVSLSSTLIVVKLL